MPFSRWLPSIQVVLSREKKLYISAPSCLIAMILSPKYMFQRYRNPKTTFSTAWG